MRHKPSWQQVRDLPADQWPRKRLIELGADSLTNDILTLTCGRCGQPYVYTPIELAEYLDAFPENSATPCCDDEGWFLESELVDSIEQRIIRHGNQLHILNHQSAEETMPHLPQPCPHHDVCGGFIEIAPAVETEFTYELNHDNECVTEVAVVCSVIAQCDACEFTELLSHETKHLTFDQAYHVEEAKEPDAEFLQTIAEMNQLYEEGSYVA